MHSLHEKSVAETKAEEIPEDPPQMWGPAVILCILKLAVLQPVKVRKKKKKQSYSADVKLESSVGKKLGNFGALSLLK